MHEINRYLGIINDMIKRFVHILCLITVCMTFAINAYAAVHLYSPLKYQVTGIDDDVVKKNVILTLLNLRSGLHVPIKPEEIHRFMKKAPGDIKNAVTPYGYFKSHVQSSLIKTSRGWLATFAVTLGPALPITAIDIDIQGEGKNNPAFQHFLNHLPFQRNHALQTEQYETAKINLYDIATQLGYFDAKMIKSQIRINLKKYYAHIIIIFNTGKRYRFGPTIFSKTPFDEKFLHRFLQYKQGQYYDAKKIEATQEGFVAGNYFNQVIIKPEPRQAIDGYIPIHVALIPRKARAYTLGLGYGTDTGVRGTLGFSIRRIGNKGHRFHTLLRASQHDSSLTAKYIIPGFNPATDQFSIAAGASNMKQSTGNAHNAKFGIGYTMTKGHWRNSLLLAYLTERYNIVNLPFTSTQLVYPTLETKYTNTDSKTKPRKGIVIETELTGADKNVLSQTNFFQAVAHINTLYTISKTHTRLLFRSDIGHTSINNLIRLPLSLQLFAGGSRSVRGYGYNSIGPGRNLVVASTEVQQKIKGAFYLAAFVDAGVVGNQNIFHHINVGTGPGIVWVTPIGAMELTIADAFTQSNDPWSVQFTMGTPI